MTGLGRLVVSLSCLALAPVMVLAPSPVLAAPKGKKKKKKKIEKPEPTPEELKQIRWYMGQLDGNKHEFVREQACDALAKFGPKAEMAVRALSGAARDRTKVIRTTPDGKNIDFTIEVTAITKRGEKDKDIVLMPNDVIHIPQSYF